MNEMANDTELYQYLKHHLECAIQVSEQIANNSKITKITNEELSRAKLKDMMYDMIIPYLAPMGSREAVIQDDLIELRIIIAEIAKEMENQHLFIEYEEN